MLGQKFENCILNHRRGQLIVRFCSTTRRGGGHNLRNGISLPRGGSLEQVFDQGGGDA